MYIRIIAESNKQSHATAVEKCVCILGLGNSWSCFLKIANDVKCSHDA